jgi:acetyl-CoA carboxylase biotin carboxylase subunit
MFRKILIANRGEIALRVIRTCKRLGIRTVAIYSEADHDALHRWAADEAYLVGGPRVAESYLNAERILEIAREASVEAIHPGYGFLSENAEFARRCEEAGFVFIGPDPGVIEKMGSKIEARKAMIEAGVPVVPGIAEALPGLEESAELARRIGYPVMLKASAGGGGIGMKRVDGEAQFAAAFEETSRRARQYFGSGEVYLEKWIEKPRHIEVQILADRHGNTVHLWERECSIQRRHQKIVEEAPSPFLDEDTRRRLCESAVRAAKSLGYSNAGTIEFLVDQDRNFYFLEMNTRLQVEHPVTEQITGLDMVEWQLRIAAGERLPFRQEDIIREGHAIETRIYAEHPETFFPSSGTIAKLTLPRGDRIRIERGVMEGSVVTPYYDPMLIKLIVSGKDRAGCIRDLQAALANFTVEGIHTNLPLLGRIVRHPAFESGTLTTSFLEDHLIPKPTA